VRPSVTDLIQKPLKSSQDVTDVQISSWKQWPALIDGHIV
jgi:hypothetical protein